MRWWRVAFRLAASVLFLFARDCATLGFYIVCVWLLARQTICFSHDMSSQVRTTAATAHTVFHQKLDFSVACRSIFRISFSLETRLDSAYRHTQHHSPYISFAFSFTCFFTYFSFRLSPICFSGHTFFSKTMMWLALPVVVVVIRLVDIGE